LRRAEFQGKAAGATAGNLGLQSHGKNAQEKWGKEKQCALLAFRAHGVNWESPF
jgi:hypothetical protein